jgi:site-specific recombinase XerD
MMTSRLAPKVMARQLVRVLRRQHPDYHYLKKVFQYTREFLQVGPAPSPTRLPALLTEAELVAFYDAVWTAQHLTHVIMLKLLLVTGMRNAELVHLRLTDVDLHAGHLRIVQGKGHKDREVLFPRSLRGELAQYVDRQRGQGQPISLNHGGTVPTRPGGYASWSRSMHGPRASRSGSTRISSVINSSPT